MKKIWRQSRTDNANDNGVRFETPQFPQATSIEDVVSIIESSEVDDLLCHSFGRELGIATDGVSENDRRKAIFLVCLASSFQQSSFEKAQHIWTAKGQMGGIVQSNCAELKINDEVRDSVTRYRKRRKFSVRTTVV